MPVLKNPRHERLAQELAQNKTATEAMAAAGYSDPRNSTRLTKKDEIRRRVEELQSRGAERAEVSVASLLGELEAAREKASDLDQLSAAVRAIEAKAKVSGLLVQRLEVTNVDATVARLDAAESMSEIADTLVQHYEADGYSFTANDKAQLIERVAAVSELLASCKAKPVNSIRGNSPADIADQERRRLGLSRIKAVNQDGS